MKKLFTLIMLVAGTISSMATVYNDQIVVNINGMDIANQSSQISVEQKENGKYVLSLDNFFLTTTPVGNIVVDDVEGISNGDATLLVSNQSITITPGNADGVGENDWLGPKLGNVPVQVKAEIRNDKLYAIIDINMAMMKQTIKVTFGDGGYQIKNSGFEEFHTATYTDSGKDYTSDEPNAWHSFNSGVATGSMAMFTKFALQVGSTSICDITRPGSNGKKSVLLKSGMVLGFQPANGTMTTGRLQAGSATATDPANCSFMDTSIEDVDANGDPFYTTMNGLPDSITVWAKFKQGEIKEADAKYNTATVSAIITDGTYYQDPEDQTYSNVVAKAQTKDIESKDFAWQRISIPFDYDTYNYNNGKALLVTISTNAQPGIGSSSATNPDSLIIDDIELIYNSTATGINIKGTPISNFNADSTEYVVSIKGDNADITADNVEVTTNAKGAKVVVDIDDIDEEGAGSVATINVISGDLKSNKVYVVKTYTEGYLTGIDNVNAEDNTVEAVYNLNGQRVENTVKGQVYITKYTNGKTVKTIAK